MGITKQTQLEEAYGVSDIKELVGCQSCGELFKPGATGSIAFYDETGARGDDPVSGMCPTCWEMYDKEMSK